jgi:bifunctional non-homologous end joining protein LigD
VAKRADSAYEAGRRSRSWLKLKAPRRAAFAVVGFLPGRGARAALGSLMLARCDEGGGLVYAGNVGSGLDEATLRELEAELGARRSAEAPCAGPHQRRAPAPAGLRGAAPRPRAGGLPAGAAARGAAGGRR